MKKISVRLWVRMLLLIGITLGLLWIFQVIMLERYYLYSHTGKIKQEGVALAKVFYEGMSELQLEEAAEEFNMKYNAGIEIFSMDGERVFVYSIMPMMMGRSMYRQEVFMEAAEGKAVAGQVKHNRFNSNILLVGIPIGEMPEVKGVMIITAPLAAIKETKEIIKEQLIIITFILVMISLLISYYFSKVFTKPILKINEAAAKMAEGNLSVKVDVESSDELGMLSDTINNLSVQLQKIEKLRKDLIANVSHEFRTPLSLIKGYAETIRDVTGDMKEKRNNQLNVILEETDRLKILVDDTLNLSQIQSESFQPDMIPFDISETVNSIMGRFAHMSEEKGITLDIQGDKGSTVVLGDESRIEQVLYNFVNNAFDHTSYGGWIRIAVLVSENNIKVEVSDNGQGIPPEELPYIWDRFYKASKNGKGKGLGLSIAKEILEAHAGSYGVESKRSEGTTFWFTLMKA